MRLTFRRTISRPSMPLVKCCCFMKNLRRASIVCGIWTLVWCMLTLGLNINELDNLYSNPEDKIMKMFASDAPKVLGLMWVTLCISFLTFLSSILVIIGTLKDNHKFLVPWLVAVFLMMVLDAASIIFNIVLMGFSQPLIIILLLWIFSTLINIYCELCVFSHFQELRAGRGRQSHYETRNGGVVRYVPAVQHIHIGDGPINYVQSQHTVYSFHSQTLYDDDIVKSGPGEPVENGGQAIKVFELKPVHSLPANMNSRYCGNRYTGSIEMKVVDSLPVIVDEEQTNNYWGSLDIQPKRHERPRRKKTLSESAACPPREPVNIVITEERKNTEFSLGGSSVIEPDESLLYHEDHDLVMEDQ